MIPVIVTRRKIYPELERNIHSRHFPRLTRGMEGSVMGTLKSSTLTRPLFSCGFSMLYRYDPETFAIAGDKYKKTKL
jgi:hypothetical protein